MLDSSVDNPMIHFDQWFAEAEATEVNDPNAMSLATATRDAAPSVRIVLLKGVDPKGFVFYTNLESRKGGELIANPQAALNFHWKALRRQVRVEGPVEPVLPEEADAYFASRPYGSRVGAWASIQSRPLDDRKTLEERVAAFSERYPESDAVGVPRPPHWSGFRVTPRRIEFWQDMPFRLHDRLIYRRSDLSVPVWETERLYP
jgi:pyridoxamine 5'-phosphate oxidase